MCGISIFVSFITREYVLLMHCKKCIIRSKTLNKHKITRHERKVKATCNLKLAMPSLFQLQVECMQQLPNCEIVDLSLLYHRKDQISEDGDGIKMLQKQYSPCFSYIWISLYCHDLCYQNTRTTIHILGCMF